MRLLARRLGVGRSALQNHPSALTAKDHLEWPRTAAAARTSGGDVDRREGSLLLRLRL